MATAKIPRRCLKVEIRRHFGLIPGDEGQQAVGIQNMSAKTHHITLKASLLKNSRRGMQQKKTTTVGGLKPFQKYESRQLGS